MGRGSNRPHLTREASTNHPPPPWPALCIRQSFATARTGPTSREGRPRTIATASPPTAAACALRKAKLGRGSWGARARLPPPPAVVGVCRPPLPAAGPSGGPPANPVPASLPARRPLGRAPGIPGRFSYPLAWFRAALRGRPNVAGPHLSTPAAVRLRPLAACAASPRGSLFLWPSATAWLCLGTPAGPGGPLRSWRQSLASRPAAGAVSPRPRGPTCGHRARTSGPGRPSLATLAAALHGRPVFPLAPLVRLTSSGSWARPSPPP